MELFIKHIVPEFEVQVVRDYVRCIYEIEDESVINKKSFDLMDAYLHLGGFRELDQQLIRMKDSIQYFKELRS